MARHDRIILVKRQNYLEYITSRQNICQLLLPLAELERIVTRTIRYFIIVTPLKLVYNYLIKYRDCTMPVSNATFIFVKSFSQATYTVVI